MIVYELSQANIFRASGILLSCLWKSKTTLSNSCLELFCLNSVSFIFFFLHCQTGSRNASEGFLLRNLSPFFEFLYFKITLPGSPLHTENTHSSRISQSRWWKGTLEKGSRQLSSNGIHGIDLPIVVSAVTSTTAVQYLTRLKQLLQHAFFTCFLASRKHFSIMCTKCVYLGRNAVDMTKNPKCREKIVVALL